MKRRRKGRSRREDPALVAWRARELARGPCDDGETRRGACAAGDSWRRCSTPTWARSLRETTCPPRDLLADRLWLWWERDDALTPGNPQPTARAALNDPISFY